MRALIAAAVLVTAEGCYQGRPENAPAVEGCGFSIETLFTDYWCGTDACYNEGAACFSDVTCKELAERGLAGDVSAAVYLSQNENGLPLLACLQCEYSKSCACVAFSAHPLSFRSPPLTRFLRGANWRPPQRSCWSHRRHIYYGAMCGRGVLQAGAA